MSKTNRLRAITIAAAGFGALAGCSQPLDMDVRGNFDQFSTAEAARMATANRPGPDERGVISYPTYKVAVARRDDTVNDVAQRIGVDSATLARYNGLQMNDNLREGELLALPGGARPPTAAAGGQTTGRSGVDIASVAGGAIDRAGGPSNAGPSQVRTASLPPANPGAGEREPVRHRVARGETAFTVARLYNVSVRALAEWNGLDSDFTVREGQYLLIPVATTSPAPSQSAPEALASTELPGAGTPTPVPPSASRPLPAERTVPVAQPAPASEKPLTPDLGQTQTAASTNTGQLAYPVQGRIIREYSKGRNDGIDIAADPGTAIVAAEAGQIAAITSDADDNHVIVVRHDGKLLTIYSNVEAISVKEKDRVSRGQKIAQIRGGASPYVHFEVRQGLESTDPVPYLK